MLLSLQILKFRKVLKNFHIANILVRNNYTLFLYSQARLWLMYTNTNVRCLKNNFNNRVELKFDHLPPHKRIIFIIPLFEVILTRSDLNLLSSGLRCFYAGHYIKSADWVLISIDWINGWESFPQMSRIILQFRRTIVSASIITVRGESFLFDTSFCLSTDDR